MRCTSVSSNPEALLHRKWVPRHHTPKIKKGKREKKKGKFKKIKIIIKRKKERSASSSIHHRPIRCPDPTMKATITQKKASKIPPPLRAVASRFRRVSQLCRPHPGAVGPAHSRFRSTFLRSCSSPYVINPSQGGKATLDS